MDNQGDVIIRELVSELRELMKQQEVSINKLSRESGVPKATVSRILRRKTYPKFGTLYKLYLTLGIKLEITGGNTNDEKTINRIGNCSSGSSSTYNSNGKH